MVSLWKTKPFAIFLLTFILQYASIELVIIAVHCVGIFDSENFLPEGWKENPR